MNLEILNQIENTSSMLGKERLLKAIGHDTAKMLRWALDPMVTFGVTINQEECLLARKTFTSMMSEDDFWAAIDRICELLSTRNMTGNKAINEAHLLITLAPTELDLTWACRILNKDLRSGFSLATFNKAHPGIIEPFTCMLAKEYDPKKHKLQGSWCVESKLDGLRMIVLNGVAYTRNGKIIDTVGHILKELEPYGDEFVFDGEVMGVTEFNEDSGKVRKKGGGPDFSLTYNVFDCVRRSEWLSKNTRSLQERKSDLLGTLGLTNHGHVHIVDHIFLDDITPKTLFEIRDRFIKKGFEGIMLKNLSSPYIFKRTDALLKLKMMKTADGRITGFFEGKGKNKGQLGGFLVDFDGVETRVGGGFTDLQREEVWASRESLVGKYIEVQFQDKSPAGVLRFPVFLKFRADKE